MASERFKTRYTGVYYREAKRLGGPGREKVYYIIFKLDGKVVEEKVGRQYRDNMTPLKASQIRGERVEGKRPGPKEEREQRKARLREVLNRPTFDKLWYQYAQSHPGLKGRRTDENRFFKHIRPIFGNKEPKDLDPLSVSRLKHELMKNHKPGTVKNVLELLRRLINFAVKRQLCPAPSFNIELPRVNNLKTEDLSPAQLESLLQAIMEEGNPNVANLMLMALYTGMRRGELFRLRWADIDFERGFILIREPKGGSDQRIPLNQATRQLLAGHPRSDSPFVFPGRNGGQRTCIKIQANRIKERAGLPKEFRALHGLRHVYASMMASTGQVDLYTLQKLLTHKSPAMTQRYAHLRDDALRKASELAGELITDALSGANGQGGAVNAPKGTHTL